MLTTPAPWGQRQQEPWVWLAASRAPEESWLQGVRRMPNIQVHTFAHIRKCPPDPQHIEVTKQIGEHFRQSFYIFY